MTSRTPRRRHRSQYGESWGIAITLLDGPLSVEQIANQFRSFGRGFGVFADALSPGFHEGVDPVQWIGGRLEEMRYRGWVTCERAAYRLTETGRGEAEKALGETKSAKERVERLATPENASKAALLVHLFLAAIKLPAEILSGSVGLLNEGIDTLLDGGSSLLVYWGLRKNREKLVSRLLAILMLATGAFTFHEAIVRLVHGEAVRAGWFAFSAVILSAAACAVLWVVQRFVGLRSNSMAPIAQSVDSRNHVIVAASVTAGLIASALSFPWLDYVVGLAVAAAIVKSAIQLIVELFRREAEEEAVLAKYRFGPHRCFRTRQLCGHMLSLVQSRAVSTAEEFLGSARDAPDFRDNRLLKRAWAGSA